MDSAELLRELEQTMKYGIVIDPLLANSFSPYVLGSVYANAVTRSETLHREYGTVSRFSAMFDIPYSLFVSRACLKETLLSTAMALSQEKIGQVIPNEEMLSLSETLIRKLLEQAGFKTLYTAYYWIIGHDLLEPFVWHKAMSLADYMTAARHYPYPPESLDALLYIGLYRGALRLRQNDEGERSVVVSRSGARTYEWVHECLDKTGYLRRRVQLSYLYQFDTVKNWDDLCQVLWPETRQIRKTFLDWLNPETQSKTLEVGCRTGGLTLDAGLFRCVNPGSVTAVDDSSLLLAQAEEKLRKQRQPANVRFELALLENLPYENNTFDLVCGTFFLSAVRCRRMIAEMARVVRTGGTVAVLQSCQFDMNAPFFRDWFEPAVKSIGSMADAAKFRLPEEEDIVQCFPDAGLQVTQISRLKIHGIFEDPELAVQYLLLGVDFFQSQLCKLPWDDRSAFISELVDRGRDICRKYPSTERILELPVVMIRGQKIGGTK